MSAVPAALVKELRDLTGAGMMDCKRALEETGGDLDAARRLLRERGMAQAGKRAGQKTTEGKVGYRIADGRGTLVAVGCETEPVANNDEFLAFARRVLEAVWEGGADAVTSLEQERIDLVARIGENVTVVGAAAFDAVDGESLAAYAHPPANKIGVLVKGKGGDDVGRRLAMHIAFAAPRFKARADVPAEEIEAERAIYEKLPEVQSKPEPVRAKIVDGMLAKRFFADSVLDEQAWIHVTSKTVGQALREEGFEPVEFERYAIGG